jgi:hypothetical protein
LEALVDSLEEIRDLLEYHLGLSPLDDIVEDAKECLTEQLEKLQEVID